ncbi:MAG: TonB-dependent receptor, partial [Steroidobacteraceae bacterium]
MSRFIRVTAAAAALLSFTIQADEAPPPLGTTVVTATRTETQLDDVLAPVIVITREELARALANDVASVLRFHAGLDIGRTGGPGQPTSIFMRGTDSNHTQVLVDGVRMNPGTIGGAALEQIATDGVERIEVVKGPRSAIYGTDAIGGVVNVISADSTPDLWAGSAGYGRYDTRLATLRGGWAGDESHLRFSASHLDTDGFAPRTIDPRATPHENLSLNVGLGTQVGGVKLSAHHWQSRSDLSYLGFSLRDFGNALVEQERDNSVSAVAADFQPLDRWRSQLRVSRTVDDLQDNATQDSLGTFESDDFARTRRVAYDWQNDVTLAAS